MPITISEELLNDTIELIRDLVADPDIDFGPAYAGVKERKENTLKQLRKLKKLAEPNGSSEDESALAIWDAAQAHCKYQVRRFSKSMLLSDIRLYREFDGFGVLLAGAKPTSRVAVVTRLSALRATINQRMRLAQNKHLPKEVVQGLLDIINPILD